MTAFEERDASFTADHDFVGDRNATARFARRNRVELLDFFGERLDDALLFGDLLLESLDNLPQIVRVIGTAWQPCGE